MSLGTVNYYPTYDDSVNFTNRIAESDSASIQTFNGISRWKVSPFSIGDVDPDYVYVAGESGLNLNADSVYYLYPAPAPLIYYYATATNASTDNSQLGTSSSYTIETIGGFSLWLVSSRSTGSASTTTMFQVDETLPAGGIYYLYAFPLVYYFATQADAQSNENIIGFPGSYNIELIGNYSVWRIDSGTGSSSPSNLYSVGDALVQDGSYYLYSAGVVYYETEADALSASNEIGVSSSYTVGSFIGYSSWFIASNSTGSSSNTVAYSDGSTLVADGTYILYPVPQVFYHATLGDAQANINIIGTPQSFTIATFNTISRWRISPDNSTGSSDSNSVYETGDTLNAPGTYYLYPADPVVRYYATEADASTAGNNEVGTSEYTVGSFIDYGSWFIASNSTGSSSNGIPYFVGDTLTPDGTYILYYTGPLLRYYETEADALTAGNNEVGTSSAYTVGSFIGYGSWFIASNSTGSSSNTVAYSDGSTLAADGIYILYPVPQVFYHETLEDAQANINIIGTPQSFTIATFNTISRWRISPDNSTGSSDSNNVYETGDTLNAPGAYFLYPADAPPQDVVFYYGSEADAVAQENQIGSSTSYTVEAGVDIKFWLIATTSTGSSSTDGNYYIGDVLTGPGIYYLYPTPILYYGDLANASAYINPVGFSKTFTVEIKGSFDRWRIASNSTGTYFPNAVCMDGTTLTPDGVYYLYYEEEPPPTVYLFYYGSESDAFSQVNQIGTSTSYTVGTVGGYSSWLISSNSTGSSSGGPYNDGDTLNFGGEYYLYPAPPLTDVLFYYATENDAYNQENQIDTSTSYTVGTVSGFTNWRITPASTGSSDPNIIYETGDTLNADGLYYLYPVLPPPDGIYYYQTEEDALANENLIESSILYTVESQSGYTYWKIAPNSTGSSSINTLYKAGDILSDPGKYYVYAIALVYYASEEDAIANTGEIGSSISYTVGTVSGYSSWLVASNSTGSSSGAFSAGEILVSPGAYYLYPEPLPDVVFYYGSEADALTQTNQLDSTATYTVQIVGAVNFWLIASTSTGSSSTDGNYPAGEVLAGGGTYYLYPTPIMYYGNESGALLVSNPIYYSKTFTIVNDDAFFLIRIASNSTGTSPQVGYAYRNGDILTPDGVYYVYYEDIPPPPTDVVFYYETEADALAEANQLGAFTTYTVETVGGFSSWLVASNSTGSSSGGPYSTGDPLNAAGLYYLYPADAPPPSNGIYYYPTQADAIANSNQLGYTATYTIEAQSGYTYWEIASNSTGTFSPDTLYKFGDILSDPGTYFLYPNVLVYFATAPDAIDSRNPIGSSETYTVETIGIVSYWLIAPTSTGSSPQAGAYIAGDILNSDGVYYLYASDGPPPTDVVYYYPTKADALADTSRIGNSLTYSIQEVDGFTVWLVASNSTGSASQTTTFAVGDLLTSSGTYYMYPATVAYYGTQADAIANTNVVGSSPTFTIQAVASYRVWKIDGGSGSSDRNLLYAVDDTLTNDGTYTLYPVPIVYYSTEADALATATPLGSSTTFTIETIGGFSSWRIASNSVGSSSRNRLYATGAVLNSPGGYYLYPGIPCFLEGSKVLCYIEGKETYIPIETIRPGTLVKTLRNGYRAVALIGRGQIENSGDDARIQNRLYKCTPSAYPEVTEDLYLTGCHSILVNAITDKQREETIAQLGKVFVTDNKYRLMACIDERAEPWRSEGTYTIWHLALENEDIHMNYGIWVNGLRVETSSINFLKKRSNMTLM